MKLTVAVLALSLLASTGLATPREWSKREAIAEVEHDIRLHKIKFYWHGGYASMPVGVPGRYLAMVARYPHADGGIGCTVIDFALLARQRKYSETYNRRMLSHILKNADLLSAKR